MRIEYFTAKWCQPCKWFGPVMEAIANDGKIPIEKIDIDDHPERIPANVMTVPTIVLYNQDVELARLSGARPEQEILDWIVVNG